jgi:predicted Zn-dependent protease
MTGRIRAAIVGGTVVLGAAAFVGLVGNMMLSRSTTAAAKDEPSAAARDARNAMSWLPWSTRPWQQLGEAQLAQGHATSAQASFRTAIGKDPRDWSLWLDLARASAGKQQASALARASALDPLSPEITEFKSELGSQGGISISASSAKP